MFKTKPEAVKKYEDEVASLESQGYEIVTVDEYVDKVKNRVPHAPLPPLLDGTWQPNSTTAVLKWLGGKSIWKGDRDNEVRTLGALAHRELVAAETAAKQAGIDARADLDAAWRLLFLSEVTDASGINPFRGEAEYGISHATEALRVARDVILRAKDALGQQEISIDPLAGSVTPGHVAELRGDAEGALFELKSDAKERTLTASWELVAPGHHRVELSISPGAETKLGVTFPGELADELFTTRALADDAVATYRRSDFNFQSMHLALPTGLISLGPSRFLIKDMARTHLAARDHSRERRHRVSRRHAVRRRRRDLGVPCRRRHARAGPGASPAHQRGPDGGAMKRGIILCVLFGLAGCEADDPPAKTPVDETLTLGLDVDIRNHADVRLVRRGDVLDVGLTLDASFGILPEGNELSGKGRVERFPEADLRLYTARFALAPASSGPCGSEPMSLALALQRRGEDSRFSGSLTAYCGKDTWAGVPARQPLRLATSSEPPAE